MSSMEEHKDSIDTVKSLDQEFLENLSTENIRQVYHRMMVKKVKGDKGNIGICSGADGVTGKEFTATLDQQIRFIQKRAPKERYYFRPLLELEVPKAPFQKNQLKEAQKAGKTRVLSLSCLRDSLVQNLMMDVLQEHIEREFFSHIHSHSYAYRKGRSTAQAMHRIQEWLGDGYSYCLKGDIEGFFDNINHKLLKKKMNRMINGTENPVLYQLLRHFLMVPRVLPGVYEQYCKEYYPERLERKARKRAKDEKTAETQVSQNVRKEHVRLTTQPRLKGIPQGGVLSGFLANLFLYDFDVMVLQLAKEMDFKYIRYADDFMLLFRSPEQSREVFEILVKFLAKEKLTLHPYDSPKTELRDLSANKKETIVFVGYEISSRYLRINPANVKECLEDICKDMNHLHLEDLREKHRLEQWENKRQYIQKISYMTRIRFQGRNTEQVKNGYCSICQGLTKRQDFISCYLAITDPRQLRELDRQVKENAIRIFTEKTGLSLSATDRKRLKQSMPRSARLYYRYKKEQGKLRNGTIAPCTCAWTYQEEAHQANWTKADSTEG